MLVLTWASGSHPGRFVISPSRTNQCVLIATNCYRVSMRKHDEPCRSGLDRVASAASRAIGDRRSAPPCARAASSQIQAAPPGQ